MQTSNYSQINTTTLYWILETFLYIAIIYFAYQLIGNSIGAGDIKLLMAIKLYMHMDIMITFLLILLCILSVTVLILFLQTKFVPRIRLAPYILIAVFLSSILHTL